MSLNGERWRFCFSRCSRAGCPGGCRARRWCTRRRGACPRPRLSGVRSMNKEMIISSGDHDTRVAILEEDQVVEIFIERERQRGVVGNIYKGRGSKVLPGMQPSFVDLGPDRAG